MQRLRRGHGLRLIVVLTLWEALGLGGTPAFAQSTLLVSAPETVSMGETFEVAVTLDLDVTITAWSYGVCNDPAVTTTLSAAPGSTTLQVNGGQPPLFFDLFVAAGGEGYITGAVISGIGAQTLDPGVGYELSVSVVRAEQQASRATIEICGSLGVPPVVPTIAVNGMGVTPQILSASVAVLPPPPPEFRFLRGEVNGDGVLNLADMITLNAQLFLGTPILCPPALDANGDGVDNIADVIYLGSYLFNGGPPPPGPFPECEALPGVGPTGCLEAGCSD